MGFCIGLSIFVCFFSESKRVTTGGVITFWPKQFPTDRGGDPQLSNNYRISLESHPIRVLQYAWDRSFIDLGVQFFSESTFI